MTASPPAPAGFDRRYDVQGLDAIDVAVAIVISLPTADLVLRSGTG